MRLLFIFLKQPGNQGNRLIYVKCTCPFHFGYSTMGWLTQKDKLTYTDNAHVVKLSEFFRISWIVKAYWTPNVAEINSRTSNSASWFMFCCCSHSLHFALFQLQKRVSFFVFELFNLSNCSSSLKKFSFSTVKLLGGTGFAVSGNWSMLSSGDSSKFATIMNKTNRLFPSFLAILLSEVHVGR